MTVGELRDKLDEFGDHVEVRCANKLQFEEVNRNWEVVQVEDTIGHLGNVTLLFELNQ